MVGGNPGTFYHSLNSALKQNEVKNESSGAKISTRYLPAGYGNTLCHSVEDLWIF